jgi:carboxymethylenebutenolidase
MGEMIQIRSTAADGFAFSAYAASPTGPSKGGVIVLQEIFGIDEHVRHDSAGMAAGIAHAQATPIDQAMADIAAVRDALAPHGKVYVVGYCYGGSLAWIAAARLDGLSGASSYYGSLVQANAALKPKCPTIIHLGRLDAMIPADAVKAAVQEANPDVPVYIYENAGHGFNNEDPERHSSDAAQFARDLTVDLFSR